MTDMHRDGFERHMRAKHFCTQEDLKLIGHRYLSAWIDHAWDAWTAALRYRDEQEKKA